MAAVAIAEHDPLFGYLLATGTPVEVEKIALESKALDEIRQQGVQLIVPLIAQGDLIGTLNLGRRLSDQPYSTDDRKLLAGLASQVAPAIRVAQLVRQQEAQAKERERIEHEMRVASLIQQTLLPKELPSIDGWEIQPYYQSARAVGGDFYDFIQLPENRIGLVIGDVTDKGVPAALVMATTRTTLRSVAVQTEDPGEVLFRANNSLISEIPPAMFITCLYGILDTISGGFVFANAGHNLPYVRTASGVDELRARGMPLGLLPDMNYEVKSARVDLGETMLLTSDGIVEAHSASGEMFGFERLQKLVGEHDGSELISAILEELGRFTPAGGDQEDDVTMVTIRRLSSALESASAFADGQHDSTWSTIASFSLPSASGNERLAMERVAEVAQGLGFEGEPLERLKTAVAEATMNAIEHGNKGDPALLTEVEVLAKQSAILIRIADQGGGAPLSPRVAPDLEAKLAGEQTPRGWGLFLIEKMVDRMTMQAEDGRNVIELEMNREGS